MSIHVVAEFRSRPRAAEQLISLLTELLNETLAHPGCEVVHLRRDHDDPAHLMSFQRFRSRQDYDHYIASHDATGVRARVDELLAVPIFVTYYDEILTRRAPSGTGTPSAALTTTDQARYPHNAASDGLPNS